MKTSVYTGEVIGFGAAALDFYRPHGEVGPDYMPGQKVGWTEHDQAALSGLMQGGHERHVGGNALNVLAYLSRQGTYQGVGFASVLGAGCEVSDQILKHIDRLGIDTRLVQSVEGYRPSVSIVERNGDRMIRGRPRDPMQDYITVDLIEAATQSARLVVVASLKNADLTEQVFDLSPQDTPLSYNPGSSEVQAYPDLLRKVMEARNPSLLAVNETEIAQLLGESEKKRSLTELAGLASKATYFADVVLCTAGTDGAILVGEGEPVCRGVEEVVPIDTLGAGDRAHAVTIHGLMQGWSHTDILAQAAASTAQVVQHTGAHGDLYSGIYG